MKTNTSGILTIGLTGGIGAGKSAAAQAFAELGVPVLDADQITRELVIPGTPGLQSIIDRFGPEIIDEKGHLQRKKLREIIFNSPEDKLWLEKLLHPLVYDALKQRLNQLKAPYAIVVIPLLLETGRTDFVDRILVIDAPEQLQISRTLARDNCPPEHIEAIMNTQIQRAERLKAADDVVINDGDVEDLKQKIRKLHEKYMKLVVKS